MLSSQSVGDRAIAAEQARVERSVEEHETITDLGFGVLEPAEYEVIRRNETGAVVRVDVGYSVSLDCDGDGDPESSIDGANTLTTYFVTEDRVRLTNVSQDVLDPGRYC